MLLEFTIENFLSYKDKVCFSMEADSTQGLDDNYVVFDENKKILKTAAIYGANASGKSNLFKVLSTIIDMLKYSSNMNINDTLPIIPFKFNNTNNNFSKFEIRFIKNNIKYVYGFSANENYINEEYLYYYPNNKKALIFDRTNTNEYSFVKDIRLLNSIKEKTANNKFFLSTATTWNYELTKPVYEFLTEDINVFIDINGLKEYALEIYSKDLETDNKLKEFALNFLKEADINITDYIFEQFIFTVSANSTKRIYIPKFIHTINNKKYTLNYEEESLGTQILFILLPFIANSILNKNKVLIVDELDKSLHPYLVKYIVKLFNNKDTNKNCSQLIFNTHETNLLDLNILRRDQIWFTEKDYKTGSSDLYALNDFGVRNNENIEKGYMLGKYGAIPNIINDINL